MANTDHQYADLVRQWVEQVWNAGSMEGLARFHPPMYQNEGRLVSIEETKQWHFRHRNVFPDIHYTIDDLFVADNRVALRWTASATHAGVLWNIIPPTGKTITWTGIHLLRIEKQQIVEVWAVQNGLAQLQQIGVTLHPGADAQEGNKGSE